MDLVIRALLLILTCLVRSVVLSPYDDEPYVELSSDSPAVLDAPLTVTATLRNIRYQDGPFVFSFSEFHNNIISVR